MRHQDGPGELATWPLRVAAYLLDSLISLPLLIVMYLLLFQPIRSGIPLLEVPAVLVAAAICLVLSLVLTIVNRWVVQGRTGRSIGKMVVGLRLVRAADGGTPGIRAFLRDLVHGAMGAIPGIGSLAQMFSHAMPLWDPERQTLSDKLARTLVVTERPAVARTRGIALLAGLLVLSVVASVLVMVLGPEGGTSYETTDEIVQELGSAGVDCVTADPTGSAGFGVKESTTCTTDGGVLVIAIYERDIHVRS